MTLKNILILDGYIDEPSTLGVPPSLSPYVRYCFGAAAQAFQDSDIHGTIRYLTIGHYRNSVMGSPKYRKAEKYQSYHRKSGAKKPSNHSVSHNDALPDADLLILLNNTPVPGNYLGGRPASPRELQELADIGAAKGMVVISWKTPVMNAINLEKDGDAFLYDLIIGQDSEDRLRTMEEWDSWSVKGAKVISQHPDYPDRLISEIDTIKGCVRYINGGCTFCTDPLETFRMRTADSVVREISALVDHGGKNFRLGGSCIFSYLSEGIGETDRPTPNPEKLTSLLRKIKKVLPTRGVFHTDNGNAGIMAEHPESSRDILKALVSYTTPGNSLSLGLESADPEVIRRNHLNANPQEVAAAVRMINQVGSGRGENGMPRLLPGLNFLYGLPGETSETHGYNVAFLKGLRKEGNLFRRINIRQLSPVRINGPHRDPSFRKWKEEIRTIIDVPNLLDILPLGTVLQGVYVEAHDGGVSFGRQVGTYPIRVGIPYPVEIGEQVDVRITDHGLRSVTGIPVPFDLDHATIKALSCLPGVGRKRAARIIMHRPIASRLQLEKVLGEKEIADGIWEFTLKQD